MSVVTRSVVVLAGVVTFAWMSHGWAAETVYNTHASNATKLTAAGDVSGLAAHMQSVKSDAALNDAEREKLLRNALLDIAGLEPDDDTRAAVRQLAAYHSKTVIIRTEHGHAEPELAFDVAAAARYAEKRWEENEAFREATFALTHDAGGLVDEYLSASAAAKTGIENAFAKTDLSSLQAQREVLLFANQSGQAVGPLSLIAAKRLSDATLYRKVIETADARTALDAVVEIGQMDSHEMALPLLEAATARSETRSAALLAIGERVSASREAEDSLFAILGGDGGSSAAAALARSNDPAIIDRLAEILENSREDMRRRHAILGLKLANSERASRHLEAFADDPSSPEGLVEEAM